MVKLWTHVSISILAKTKSQVKEAPQSPWSKAGCPVQNTYMYILNAGFPKAVFLSVAQHKKAICTLKAVLLP